jgi:hypothetical protein
MSDVVTTALELLCIVLLSVFCWTLYQPAALLPWAAAAGLAVWVRYPKRKGRS